MGRRVFYDAGTFINHRRVGWGYDASGRITTIDSRTFTYDAAGRNINLTGQQLTATSTISTTTQSGFDGEGNRVRENSGTGSSMTLKYYLRSSVLGGEVIEGLNSSGQKQIGYVYTPSGIQLATQTIGQNFVKFIQKSPLNTTERGAFTTGGSSRVEFDAVGAKVRTVNLSPPDRGGDPGNIPMGGLSSLDSRYGSLENPGAGCTLEGVYMPCYMAMRGVGTATTVVYVDPFYAASSRARYSRQVSVEEETTTAVLSGNVWTIYAGTAGHFEYVDDPDDVLETYTQDPPMETQNPDTFNLAGISKVADAILNDPDCIKFAETILNQLSRGKGGSLLETFNSFFDQPKKHDLFTRNRPVGSRGESTALGTIKDSTASVFLRRGDDQISLDANNLVQELFHFVGDGYSDEQLARALNKTSYAADASKVFPDGTANIFDANYFPGSGSGKWSKADGYSTYFHAISSLHCGLSTPNQYRNKR